MGPLGATDCLGNAALLVNANLASHWDIEAFMFVGAG